MKFVINVVTISILFSMTTMSNANGWFGNNNGFGNFFGNNNRYGNDCNDWPIWTPMYWMQEMAGNDNCYGGYNRFGNNYSYGNYPSHHQVLNSTQGYGAYANPFSNSFANRFVNPYAFNPYAGGSSQSPVSRFPSSSALPFSQFGGNRFTNPFTSFGSGSPWNGFSSPMSPMGGFGSPFSPMGMGSYGIPGMNPMSSFVGGMPFGGSGFSPFR